jgi:hypothetical protein
LGRPQYSGSASHPNTRPTCSQIPSFPRSPMATTAYRRFSAVLCHGHPRLSGAGRGGPPTPAPCAAYDLSSRMVARSSLSGQEDTTCPVRPMLATVVPLRCPRTSKHEVPGVIHWPSTALAGEPLSAQVFCGFPRVPHAGCERRNAVLRGLSDRAWTYAQVSSDIWFTGGRGRWFREKKIRGSRSVCIYRPHPPLPMVSL